MATCPAGHTSTNADYCDICGLPVTEGAPVIATTPAPVPLGLPCPNCSSINLPEALFCEACGYDYTTGTMPRGAVTQDEVPSPPIEWVAEIWIDPDWYATQGSSDPLPSPGLPDVVPVRKTSLLIGRVSVSRNIHPDLDCELDSGVSRRHAQVSTDGTRWWVEDLDSANGTFIGSAAGPLPSMPIGRGRIEVAPDQRIYLGAWTRIVVRRATDDEIEAFAV